MFCYLTIFKTCCSENWQLEEKQFWKNTKKKKPAEIFLCHEQEEIYTNSKKKQYILFIYFFLVKRDFFKCSIIEFFCFLIRNIIAAFEVAAKSCVIVWRKSAKTKFKIFLNKCFSRFQFTCDLHDALNQKNIKTFEFDWK